MDKKTRNDIQVATQAARTLLERDFREQLEGTYDILLDGTITEQPGSHLSERQKVTREKLVVAVAHKRSTGLKAKEAVDAYLREAAFTTLNRFVALKMLEARKLVQECVSKGENSSGFREFTALAPGLIAVEDKGYRLYIETLFDEIGQEVKVLFDRHDVASLLWPNRQTLLELLAILNAPELASVWDKDETIGWVYQYFNGDEERAEMRAESQAPRNSRELAVRNQFFTPRYVVQFLTDNTLGRIWYEMMQGETKLAHLNYLVRRPNEIFLAEGESAPDSEMDDSELSQEELLQQKMHVPFRAKKDPRDLRILDPACGSGHFLLYAFELLISIYEEAWSDAGAAVFTETGTQLRDDYGNIDALRYAMPELILRHNLHGVDIDPRAAQIAALALWMRAQRAYNQFDVARTERPPITKTNIVVAEPMPGDAELVEEFAASLKPAILGDLFKKMVEEMKLAGELGSLLKIEESIAKAVKDAAEVNQQGNLFAGKIESQDFWDTADEKIIEALANFAESAAGSAGIRRKLFVCDAAQGVAFIELMRKCFDVVLMNPPFGMPSSESLERFRGRYPIASDNLYVAFLVCAKHLTRKQGSVGALTDRSWINKRFYGSFRRQEVIPSRRMDLWADLGSGVLDANVEVAAHTYSSAVSRTRFSNFLQEPKKANALRHAASHHASWIDHDIESFKLFPDAAFVYHLPPTLASTFANGSVIGTTAFKSFGGLKAANSAHLFRLYWEVPITAIEECSWAYLQNGSPFCPYYFGTKFVVRCDEQTWRTVLSYTSSRITNSDQYFGPGLFYGKRTDWMYAYVGRANQVPSMEGHLVTPYDWDEIWKHLLVINSSVYQEIANQLCGQHKYAGYVNPIRLELDRFPDWRERIKETVGGLQSLDFGNETSPLFVRPKSVEIFQNGVAVISDLFDAAVASRLHVTESANHLRHDYNRAAESEFRWPGPDKRPPEKVDYVRHLFGESDSPVLEAKLLVSYLFGIAVGRWSLVFAKRCISLPIDPDSVFEELPPYPYALRGCVSNAPLNTQLTEQTVDSATFESQYQAPAFLVDDVGHVLDLLTSIGSCADQILNDHGEATITAAVNRIASTVSISGLRGWFRCGFFGDHLARYSRGKLKAPIYWQLATPSASYSVWCYYHRLTRDTFFRVANDYVTPKVDHEERKLNALRQEAGPDPSSKQRKAIDAQETFVVELRAFKTEVTRIAPLWNPNLNDGVIINFAPLWRLVPQHKPWQKECKKVWDKLVKGDYDWAHLAMHLWPERVVPKCKDERSLAIAHGLEEEFWIEDDKGKWQKRQVSGDQIGKLIAERASTAVNAALQDLLEAPAPVGQTRRRRRARS